MNGQVQIKKEDGTVVATITQQPEETHANFIKRVKEAALNALKDVQ